MRLFTAIDIPAGIKAGLCALLDRLRPLAEGKGRGAPHPANQGTTRAALRFARVSPGLSWSPGENLHVTTKFIGEWPEPRIDEVRHALAAVPRPGPVEIAVRGLGWFPNDRNPRVFWAGIEAGAELRTLAHDTEQALAAIGVAVEERGFHPHLTLARRRHPVPIDRLRKEVAELSSSDFGSFRAESFFLYLSRAGKYTKLHEFPLLPTL